MTTCTIKLFGSLRRTGGGAVHQVSGATLREVLETLCDHNEPLRAAIFTGDALKSHVRVMVNGHDCELAAGLATAVTANDQIAIFPPIAGG